MSAMAKPPSLEFKEVSRQLESFQQVDSTRQQLLEQLLQRMSELDTALQAANSDLEDQTSIRRQWKKRAEVAEASLIQNQFVLALIDGNRYTFADQYLKNAETGGEEAAKDLVDQIRGYIQERKLHDDPTKVCLMIYIFANKTALSQALIDSGTISEPEQLDNFITHFMRSQPFVYFIDCGSFEGAVDSKIQESYEFHFDNAHCKHLLLALRHESGYIAELDTYCEDESTLARTSLMRSSHAVVGKLAAAFHFADTPALRTLALISLEHPHGTPAEENGESSPSVIRTRFSSRNRDLQSLFEAEDQESPAAERGGLDQPRSIEPTSRELDSSTTSRTDPASSNGRAVEPPEPIKSLPLKQELQKVASPNPTPVHQSLTAPYLGHVHSYMSDWESAPSTDIYTPPPDLRPWGSEAAPSWADSAGSKGKAVCAPHRANGAAPAEIAGRAFEASAKTYASKVDRQYGGIGTARSPTGGEMRRQSHQSPPPRRNPGDIPGSNSKPSQGLSTVLLESKYSLLSKETSSPQSPGSGPVAINRHGQRIDQPLERPPKGAQARWESGWKSVKLCNDHHLRGACSAQNCMFSHDPIDDGVRQVLRENARRIPCRLGTKCRQPDCPNGHHCPYRLGPGGCKNQQCPFAAKRMHQVDDLTIDRFIQAH